MKKLSLPLLLGICLCSSTTLLAFGEKPTFEEGQTPATPAQLGGVIAAKPVSASITTAKTPTVNILTEEDIATLRKKYQDALTQKQFPEALINFAKLPTASLNRKDLAYGQQLRLFARIDAEMATANPLLLKEGDVDEETKKSGIRWYKEAENALLLGNNPLAKDLLIQILYTQRWHFRAKKLLEYGLDLPAGTYKIEDMITKYDEKSRISFYGGNYSAAVEALTTLLLFRQEDPLLYERLGSSYYMMGEGKKAIEAWNTALFFNPNNKELEAVVARAKVTVDEAAKEAKEREKNRKKTTEAKAAPTETQTFGIFRTQNEAYNFAGELKKKGMVPIVEETDNGKWAVKVPVSQIQKKK